jgi:hypothetical protein
VTHAGVSCPAPSHLLLLFENPQTNGCPPRHRQQPAPQHAHLGKDAELRRLLLKLSRRPGPGHHFGRLAMGCVSCSTEVPRSASSGRWGPMAPNAEDRLTRTLEAQEEPWAITGRKTPICLPAPAPPTTPRTHRHLAKSGGEIGKLAAGRDAVASMLRSCSFGNPPEMMTRSKSQLLWMARPSRPAARNVV